MVPFAKFLPDLYSVNAALAGDASGVLPGPNSYKPWPQPVVFSPALAAACKGAALVRTTAGGFSVFAGTATKLYKYVDHVTAWTDVTRLAGGDYTVAAGDLWSFAQFGINLIAVNAADAPQTIDIDAGTNFAALGGSPPQARYVRTVGDILMLGGLNSNVNRVQWSGRNNSAFYTAGERDSDFQDFPDGGWVRGIFNSGPNTGLIFQDDAIRRFAAVNSRSVFEFARVEGARGLKSPHSLVAVGSRAYYFSEDGFYATDGSGQSAPIGRNAVNDWALSIAEYDGVFEIVGAADPLGARVFWLIPGVSGDYILCYDIGLNAWSYAQVNAQYIFSGATTGYTIDNIGTLLTDLGFTLETAPFSFDARFLEAGAPFFAMFDTANKLNFFSGKNMAATVETGDFQPIPGRRSMIRGARLVGDSTAAKIAGGGKERPQGTITLGAAAPQNNQGFCPFRSSGMYHRLRATSAVDETWTFLQGVDPDVVAEGQR